MAVADGNTLVFGVNDCKVTPITKDDASGFTLGTPIDVPGVNEIQIKTDVLKKEAYGDEVILDIFRKTKMFTGSIKAAYLNQAVMQALLGGTVTTSGTTPNTLSAYKLTGANTPQYFKVEAQVSYLGGEKASGSGDFHLILWKVAAFNPTFDLKAEDYAGVSFDIEALPARFDSRFLELDENETAVAISTTSDATAPTITATTPAAAAVGVSVNATVAFTFSKTLNAATATEPGNFAMTKADGTEVVLNAPVYDAVAKTVTLTPTSALAAATVQIVTVTTGVRDTFGNRLAAAYGLKFTTA